MVRQTLQLVVVVAGLAFSTGVHAQSGDAQSRDWKVANDTRRDAKVVHRYRQLLLRNPDQRIVYRSLLSKLGRGPALAPFIDDIRQRAQSSSEAEPWILLGHLELERGHDAASRSAYERAVVLEPDNPATHAALGAALDRAGHAAAADAAYERALTLSTSTSDRRRLLRTLADLSLAKSDWVRAVQWMRTLAQTSPRSFDLRVELADTQLRAHQFDAALGTFEIALGLAGRSGKRRAQILVEIGNLHRRMHTPHLAEAAYREALSLVGKESWMRHEVLLRLVDAARDQGSLPTIVRELEREWRVPNYHDTMVLAGLSEELGDSAAAVAWLERAARLDRRAIEPRTRLIAHLDHERDATRIRALYAEIVSLRPDDVVQRVERIEWMFFRGEQAAEAIAELRAAERQLQRDPTALVEVAATWQRFGMPDAALSTHRDIDRAFPKHVGHLEAYGELLARLGRTAEADAVWKRLVELDPDDLGVRLRLAEIAARLKDYERATALLEWVLERAPRLAAARQRLAGLLETRKMWVAALHQWELLFFDDSATQAGRRIAAIAQNTVFIGDSPMRPDPALLQRWEGFYAKDGTPRVGFVLAQIRHAEGRYADALSLAAEIAAQDPATLKTDQHLAWVDCAEFVVKETAETDPMRAIAVLERIASAFGDRRTPAWHRVVDLSLRVEDNEARRAILDRALAAVPNDSYVHSIVGLFWSDTEIERAIHHFRRAVALGSPTFDVYFDLASHLAWAGHANDARAVYLEVMRRDTSGSWASSAAFSAIDLCNSDEQLMEVEGVLADLNGRLDADAYRAIAVAIYHELFVYGSDPARAFAKVGARALPRLVAAVQSEAVMDRLHAANLLQMYSGHDVASQALKSWPSDIELWSTTMIVTLARTRDARVSHVLVAALAATDPSAQAAATYAVGLARVADATTMLCAALNDADARSDIAPLAVAALGRIGGTTDVAALEDYARRTGRDVLVTWALGQSNSAAAAEALSARLTHPSAEVRRLAGIMLAGQGDDGLRSLLVAAWDADAVRRAMADVGLRSVQIEEPMWDAENLDADVDPKPESAVARALAASTDRPVARAFVGRESVVVSTAADFLDRANERVLEHLAMVADEAALGSADVAVELAPSLRLIVRGLRPRLRGLAASPDVRVMASAAALLPLAGDSADAQIVANAAARLPSKEGVRVLSRMDTYPWAEIRPTIIAGLRDGDERRRETTLRVLARNPEAAADRVVTDLVVRLAEAERGVVRAAAIDALGALKVEDSAAMLAEIYDGAGPRAQAAIRESLARMTSPTAREAARALAIKPTRPVCAGNPEDLGDLLADSCVGAVEILDF